MTFHLQSGCSVPTVKKNNPGEGSLVLDWKASHFPWPFWAVTRMAAADPSVNMCFETLQVRRAVTYGNHCISSGPLSDVIELSIPFMTNPEPLVKGKELVVVWPARGLCGNTGIMIR